MGGGAQLARTQADLILLSENLDHLRRGIAFPARRYASSGRTWYGPLPIISSPCCMFGFITPWMAGIGMSGSSLLVVLNSLRLQRPL